MWMATRSSQLRRFTSIGSVMQGLALLAGASLISQYRAWAKPSRRSTPALQQRERIQEPACVRMAVNVLFPEHADGDGPLAHIDHAINVVEVARLADEITRGIAAHGARLLAGDRHAPRLHFLAKLLVLLLSGGRGTILGRVHAEDHVIELNLGVDRFCERVARITILLFGLGRARHLDPEPKIVVAVFLPGRCLRPRRGREHINRRGSGCERSQRRHETSPRPAGSTEYQT